MSSDLQPYLDFAVRTARKAGQLTLSYFQNGLEPEWKSDDSPVTLADRQAEQLILAEIAANYPGSAIVGEEFGQQQTGSSLRWIIDPIDGTRAFVRGVPLYGVLLGLEIDEVPAVGVAYYPALDEMISAATGLGCWWEHHGKRQPARVSTESHLPRALVAHANWNSFARLGKGAAWQRLSDATGYQYGWADCYGYLLVATGRAEVSIDPIMNPWDCGPFPVILSEAGGYFGDWQGNVTSFGGEAVATNAALHQDVLRLLGE